MRKGLGKIGMKVSISNTLFVSKFLSEYSQCHQKRQIDGKCSDSSASKMLGSPSGSQKVPNIMMLGKTGAGKSFFGNGIIGEKDPEKGKL